MKLFTALFLVAFPASSFGLKCYECVHLSPTPPGEDSTEDPLCLDPPSNYLRECDYDAIPIPIPTYSRSIMEMVGINFSQFEKDKTQQETEPEYSCASLVGSGYGIVGVYRGCVTKVPDICESGGQKSDVQMCFCSAEGCNRQ